MRRWLPCLALLLAVSPVGATLFYSGVNLSGAEFGQTSLPGTYGTHYTYPTAAEVDYYRSKGLNTFRVPIRWERLQRSLNSPLDTTELNRLSTFVNYATSKGAFVIIEPHNFCRYYPQPAANYQTATVGLIGNDVPISAFADFWSRVANVYKTNPKVAFNLMNEPANMNTDVWVNAANSAIAAIRATGATNQIQVPGNRYTGAWTWNNSDSWGRSNAAAMLDVVDPLNAMLIEVHQYFDSDGSGTSASIAGNNVNIGPTRLAAFTNWARANRKKAFLGEFAFANSSIGPASNQIGDEALINTLNFLRSNTDVWTGWAWWGGGPWWPQDYLFNPNPIGGYTNGTDRPMMQYLTQYAGPAVVPEPAMLGLLIPAAVLLRRRR
jgi:endoglucanase